MLFFSAIKNNSSKNNGDEDIKSYVESLCEELCISGRLYLTEKFSEFDTEEKTKYLSYLITLLNTPSFKDIKYIDLNWNQLTNAELTLFKKIESINKNKIELNISHNNIQPHKDLNELAEHFLIKQKTDVAPLTQLKFH